MGGQQTFNGQNISAMRPARQGDKGFKEGEQDQMLITLQDGTTRVVKQSDLQQGQQR